MELFVSNVDKVPGMIHLHGITHVLTLLRGRELNDLMLPRSFNRGNWLHLDMDDVVDGENQFSPSIKQVDQMLKWAKSLPDGSRLLVHCHAGISRSTAAALAIKVMEKGVDMIPECIEWLVQHRPVACPNPLITKYADHLLGANGRLHDAAEDVARSKLLKIYGNSVTIVDGIRNNIKI